MDFETNQWMANRNANQMMALPNAVITTPVSMPLNPRISSSLIIEGPPSEKATSAKIKARLSCPN
jgi:hypothetical protein